MTYRTMRIAAIALIILSLAGCASVKASAHPASTPTPRSVEVHAARTDSNALPEYATDGYVPIAHVIAPYGDVTLVDVTKEKVDPNGLAIWRDSSGVRQDHPVYYAQYGIGALIKYAATGDQMWLERAIANATRLEQIHVDRGDAWFYPYLFNWTYVDRTLTAPWYSGMAQGEALSLFSRLAAVQPQGNWGNDAYHTFESFRQQKSATEPWSSVVIDGNLWFEEYAGNQPPLQVLNGHIFAMFGLYDYWALTGDLHAAKLFDGGATTVLAHMPQIEQPGGPSYYCVQANYCRSSTWQNQSYHPIHIWQLISLTRLTGNPAFSVWANKLNTDFAAPPLK